MRIQIPKQPRYREIPRSAWAPWLKPGVRRFRLTADFIVYVDEVRFLVPCGYITDHASIPKYLHWLFPPSYKPVLCASIWHDRAYSHWHLAMSKRYADDVFYHIMLNQGADPKIAKLFKWAVSLFGRGGWK